MTGTALKYLHIPIVTDVKGVLYTIYQVESIISKATVAHNGSNLSLNKNSENLKLVMEMVKINL